MASYESMSPTPALGDYIAAAWRRRYVVLIAVVLGGVLGAVVVPMASHSFFRISSSLEHSAQLHCALLHLKFSLSMPYT